MSPEENQLSFLDFRCLGGPRARVRRGPLTTLFKIFASLCFLITITFIVWSWSELQGRRLYQIRGDSEDAVFRDRDTVIAGTILRNDLQNATETGPGNAKPSDKLFTERKSYVKHFCSKRRSSNVSLNAEKVTKPSRISFTTSRRSSGSRRNWIFINSDNINGAADRTDFRRSPDLMSTKGWALEWCPVYKAASTPWMAMFAKLFNVLTPHTEELIRKGKLTFIKLLKDFRFNMPSKAANSTSKINYKMLIVRHPFSRLLSAFRDKLERIKGREFYHRKYGYRILTQFRYAQQFNQLREAQGSNTEKFHTMLSKILELRNGVGIVSEKRNQSISRLFQQKLFPIAARERPTFHEFVQYLIQADPRSMDEHWRPMYLDCDPCKNNFDFILQVETMEQDRSIVLDLLGFHPNRTLQSLESVWKRWTNRGREDPHSQANGNFQKFEQGESKLSPLEAFYFSKVPKSDLSLLYLKYEVDFRLFNYSAQPYFLMAR